ncbi:MAG: hypothetical protein OEZ65_09440 [Gemmatimonadota bacterium]|nr:hypothetical protein [Gemmatimonadota bacterium]
MRSRVLIAASASLLVAPLHGAAQVASTRVDIVPPHLSTMRVAATTGALPLPGPAGTPSSWMIPLPYVDPELSLRILDSIRADRPEDVSLHLAAAREASALGVLEPTSEARVAALRRAEAAARSVLAVDSLSVEGHYWLAVTLGLQADEEGGRTKIGLARESYAEAGRALALDPLHGGANHVMGRLHAGAKRLNLVSRMLARGLGLGGVLDQASWESAEHHLRAAAEADDGRLVHHLELARFLLSRGRTDEGRAILRDIAGRSPRHRLDAVYIERAAGVLAGSTP